MSQSKAREARRQDPATGHMRRTKAALRDARSVETRERRAALQVEKREVRAEQREAKRNLWGNLNALFARGGAK